MLLNPVLSRRAGWTTALLLALSAAGATAGTLDPPAAPTDPASAMFTLTDLYNRLDAGTEGSKRGGSFVEPPDGAIAGTGYTLDQIMGLMPTLDNVTGAGVADVLEGKEFWGLTGGAWGLQTGTATAGASFDGGNGVKVITIPNGLYSGGKTATAIDSALDPANIKKGVTIFGTLGTFTDDGDAGPGDLLFDKKAYVNGELVTGIATAGASFDGGNGVKVITIPDGLYSGNKTATAADNALDPANIKKDVTIFGVKGTYESAASAPCTCSNPANVTNGRWCDNGNGTVTDLLGATVAGTTSGVRGRCLVWLQNAGWGGTKNWRVNAIDGYDDAHARAGILSDGTAGLSDGSVEGDWRLPTKVELQALTTDSSAGDKISSSTPTVLS